MNINKATKETRAKHFLEDAINILNLKIAQGIVSDSYNSENLKEYRSYLQLLLKNIESGEINQKKLGVGGLGRMIVDSWPFNDELGESLINAEQSYKEL